jgi:hypothetical protein
LRARVRVFINSGGAALAGDVAARVGAGFGGGRGKALAGGLHFECSGIGPEDAGEFELEGFLLGPVMEDAGGGLACLIVQVGGHATQDREEFRIGGLGVAVSDAERDGEIIMH